MYGLDGVETTHRLLALSTPPRVLILTTFDRNEYLYESLRAGVSGFLLKDVRRGQLTDAIRTVAAGETLLAPTITRRLIEQFCQHPHRGPARHPSSPTPPLASAKSSYSSAADSRTPRSPPHSWSPKPPSRPTSPTSSPSSNYATARKPSSSPTTPASSNLAKGTEQRRSQTSQCIGYALANLEARTDLAQGSHSVGVCALGWAPPCVVPARFSAARMLRHSISGSLRPDCAPRATDGRDSDDSDRRRVASHRHECITGVAQPRPVPTAPRTTEFERPMLNIESLPVSETGRVEHLRRLAAWRETDASMVSRACRSILGRGGGRRGV
jgi:hypothetical protein